MGIVKGGARHGWQVMANRSWQITHGSYSASRATKGPMGLAVFASAMLQ
jgi:hypothetical protein